MGDDAVTGRDELPHGLASAVHELRTPLVTIRGFLETLRDRDQQLTAEVRAHVIEVAHRNAVLLGQRIEALLRYERLAEDPHLVARPRHLAEVVARIGEDCSGVLAAHHLEVEVPDAIWADLDADALTHVLANLLGNAARHSPSGSTVTIRARRDDDTVRIEVVDAGSGISQEDLPHVFDAWYRGADRPSEGSGLGLALVRRYVEAWGGRVEIASTSGQGTTVAFTLPAANRPAPVRLPEDSLR